MLRIDLKGLYETEEDFSKREAKGNTTGTYRAEGSRKEESKQGRASLVWLELV